MAQMNAVANWRNSTCGGRQYLPPKIPLASLSPASAELDSNPFVPIPRPRDRQRRHQHTASDFFLIEEQPSWLDELLNEPETPVKKATHRRSSSDSFAYVDMDNIAYSTDSLPPEGCMNGTFASFPSCRLNAIDQGKHMQYASYCADMHMHGRMHKNRMKTTPIGAVYFNHPTTKDSIPHHKKGSTRCTDEPDVPSTNSVDRESGHDSKSSPERKPGLQAKQSLPENDQKRVKQLSKLDYQGEISCPRLQNNSSQLLCSFPRHLLEL